MKECLSKQLFGQFSTFASFLLIALATGKAISKNLEQIGDNDIQHFKIDIVLYPYKFPLYMT